MIIFLNKARYYPDITFCKIDSSDETIKNKSLDLEYRSTQMVYFKIIMIIKTNKQCTNINRNHEFSANS